MCTTAYIIALYASLLVVLARHNQKLPGRGSLGAVWGGWHLMYAHICPMHAHTSLHVHRHMPPYVHKRLPCSLWAPPRGFLARCARSTQLQAAKLIERSDRGSIPSDQSDIQSNSEGCGAHLEAPRPTHGGICMHIWAYMCIHGVYVCTRWGICAGKLRSAACSLQLKNP